MVIASGSLLDSINAILSELDKHAQMAERRVSLQSEGRQLVTRRQFPRHVFRCECVVRCFGAPMDTTIISLPGCTRNLARGGVTLISKRPFHTGEVLEIEADMPGNHLPMFMAGDVRHVRYVRHGYHEVGVRLRATGGHPIFTKDTSKAMLQYDWVRPLHLTC